MAGSRSEAEERLPLSDWEILERPEGEVHAVSADAHLALFFTLVALRIVPADVPSPAGLGMPHDARTMKRLVTKALDTLESNATLWNLLGVVPNRSERADHLRLILDAVEGEQERRERLHLMEQSLSSTKVQQLKDEALRVFNEEGFFRRAFAEAGALEYTDEEPPATLRTMRLAVIVDKAMLVDDPGPVIWVDPYRGFGDAMARGENDAIWRALRERAPAYVPGRRFVASKLGQIVRVMRLKGCPPDLLVFSGALDTLRLLETSTDYVPWYRMPDGTRVPMLRGRFQDIPVYSRQFESKNAADEFMLLSASHAAHMMVYATGPEQPVRTFLVKEYTLDEATAVAQGDRSWLPEEARSLTTEALVDYLRERVSIRLEEIFEVIVQDPLAVRILRVPHT